MSLDIEICAVVYGRSELPESMIFRGGDTLLTRPIVFAFYDIRVGARHILVDAGCDTMPGFVMRDHITPAEALQKIGVSPEQVTDILVTHAHHDHIQGVRYFPNATVWIQERALRDGKAYLTESRSVQTFSEECVIGGCVHARHMGGHAPGSCIATLRAHGKEYVFCGDECYLLECLERKIPTGASVCPEKSKAFVETYSDRRYTPLLCHDPGVNTGRII